jgi:hypothetical protein
LGHRAQPDLYLQGQADARVAQGAWRALAHPDRTPAELPIELKRRLGIVAGISTSLRAAEQDRPDGAAKRQRWRVHRVMAPTRFVFLDETGTATH